MHKNSATFKAKVAEFLCVSHRFSQSICFIVYYPVAECMKACYSEIKKVRHGHIVRASLYIVFYDLI